MTASRFVNVYEEEINTTELPAATTSPQRPVFQKNKSFQVKSLYFEPLVSDHLTDNRAKIV